MRNSRIAAAALLAISTHMQLGQMQSHKHVAVQSKGKASLHQVVTHGVAVRAKAGYGHAIPRKMPARGLPERHATVEHATAESRHLSFAFSASATLRPMAQQLLATRSGAAYTGVLAYAAAHSGEAASAADLAIAHAYSLDHHYGDAESAFRAAAGVGDALADYADYLGAQAAISAGRPGDAISVLENFEDKHPDSLFVPQAPILLANAYLAGNDPNNALRVLQSLASRSTGRHLDIRVALAKAYQASGNTGAASSLYRAIYLDKPLSGDAAIAKAQLAALNVPLTPGERKEHADAMFNAKQYADAAAEYRALQQNEATLSQADRNALKIYAAVCDLRLRRITRSDVNNLPLTSDDTAALKMYLQSELARSDGNSAKHDALVEQMSQQFPNSRWLEEALYSGGNMYLIKRDRTHAIADYIELVARFPRSVYAPSAHWRTAWLKYQLRHNADSARMFDDQITKYPGGQEIPGALYWRGRLYEDVEGNFGQAINYYKAVNTAYVNSYYAMLARQRLAVLGNREAVEPSPILASVRPVKDPHLVDELPEDDPHLIKARLLANAALNEYIRPEIQLSPTSGQWGALAEAEIYQSFGENAHALQAMKRSNVPFFSLPVADVPTVYWQLVFPRPYWQELAADSQSTGLDPYLVASLIRQESEFNPAAVSRASACGLMQLLPYVAKSLAKKSGEKHFDTNELFDPLENLRLGTIYLRQNVDRYGGQIEYALAAYNAGDTPVRQWIASGDYKDIPEWVESIPYSETRDYVQAILRNSEIYRTVYTKQ